MLSTASPWLKTLAVLLAALMSLPAVAQTRMIISIKAGGAPDLAR